MHQLNREAHVVRAMFLCSRGKAIQFSTGVETGSRGCMAPPCGGLCMPGGLVSALGTQLEAQIPPHLRLQDFLGSSTGSPFPPVALAAPRLPQCLSLPPWSSPPSIPYPHPQASFLLSSVSSFQLLGETSGNSGASGRLGVVGHPSLRPFAQLSVEESKPGAGLVWSGSRREGAEGTCPRPHL